MSVIDFAVSWLLKYVVLLLIVKIMLKAIKNILFLHMKSCNENFLELPVQYIYLLHVTTVCFTNKGASIELLFEMNTNTLFDNQFYLNYVFLQTRNF